MIQTSLSYENLCRYVRKQIDFYFPDEIEHRDLNEVVYEALQKVDYNFSFVNLRHYYKSGVLYFNHLNSDQYTVFIYYASNIAYEVYNDEVLASKLFYLNKTLNQFHCMYNTKLPDIFLLIHSTGIILGKAKYNDFFVLSHHCNVGANVGLEYPEIGKFTIMYPYSSIIGNSNIGYHSCIANGTYINNAAVSENKIIFGRSPHLTIKDDKRNRLDYFFKNYEPFNEK